MRPVARVPRVMLFGAAVTGGPSRTPGQARPCERPHQTRSRIQLRIRRTIRFTSASIDQILTLRSRRLFMTTETELNAMASAARIGFSSLSTIGSDEIGYSAPAATGIRIVL